MTWTVITLSCSTNIFVLFAYISLKRRLDVLQSEVSQLTASKKLNQDELDHRQSLLTRLSEVQNARFSSLTRG